MSSGDPLRGRVIAVTGAARGIGQATADALERAGALVARGDILPPPGSGAGAYHVDVRDVASFRRFLDEAEDRLGPLWGLVNNAGVNFLGALATQPPEAIDRQIDVNLRGAINGIQAAVPRMRPRREGHIVNVASVAGRIALPGSAVYCATKHALVGLSEAARLEVGGDGIGVAVLMPGLTNTEMTAGQPRLRLTPVSEPADVADAVVELFRRPRAVAYVPASQRPLAALWPHLPVRVRDWIGRVSGADRAFAYDESERAEYHARILDG